MKRRTLRLLDMAKEMTKDHEGEIAVVLLQKAIASEDADTPEEEEAGLKPESSKTIDLDEAGVEKNTKELNFSKEEGCKTTSEEEEDVDAKKEDEEDVDAKKEDEEEDVKASAEPQDYLATLQGMQSSIDFLLKAAQEKADAGKKEDTYDATTLASVNDIISSIFASEDEEDVDAKKEDEEDVDAKKEDEEDVDAKKEEEEDVDAKKEEEEDVDATIAITEAKLRALEKATAIKDKKIIAANLQTELTEAKLRAVERSNAIKASTKERMAEADVLASYFEDHIITATDEEEDVEDVDAKKEDVEDIDAKKEEDVDASGNKGKSTVEQLRALDSLLRTTVDKIKSEKDDEEDVDAKKEDEEDVDAKKEEDEEDVDAKKEDEEDVDASTKKEDEEDVDAKKEDEEDIDASTKKEDEEDIDAKKDDEEDIDASTKKEDEEDVDAKKEDEEDIDAQTELESLRAKAEKWGSYNFRDVISRYIKK